MDIKHNYTTKKQPQIRRLNLIICESAVKFPKAVTQRNLIIFFNLLKNTNFTDLHELIGVNL